VESGPTGSTAFITMLRSAGIFLAAILLPSLVLAWLAVRSAHDQEIVLQHQQAIICQDITDSLAKSERNQVDIVRSEFVQITQDLLSKSASPQATATAFDHVLRAQWPPAEIGFAVDLRGSIYSPDRDDGPAARMFFEENERFLTNREFAEVYSSFNSQSLVARQEAQADQVKALVPTSPLTFAQVQSPSSNQAQVPLAGAVSASPLPIENARIVERANSSTNDASAAPLNADALQDELQAKNTSVLAATAATRRSGLAGSQSQANAAPALDAQSGSADMSQLQMEKAAASEAASSQAIMDQSALAQSNLAQANSIQINSFPSVATVAVVPTTTNAVPDQASAPDDNLNQNAFPQKASQFLRNVAPQNAFTAGDTANAVSNTIPLESDFRRLIGSDTSGVLARFLDNTMRLMVWYRPTATDNLVFGAQLNQARVLERLQAVLQTPEFAQHSSPGTGAVNYCLVLLDDTGKPVAFSLPGFQADWKHPFVATEIGDALPHWEAALYLTDPAQITRSANTLRLTISLIVLLLIVAIVAGGSIIASDVRRQMRLAQQKTDFVSNVSHELKTPLTSIRMFADLLAEGRVDEPERQSTYLKIISAESARLTRLINNVLDFARLERGAPDGERRPCDLTEIARDVVETCLPHLEANGQNLTCEIEAESLPVAGDRDALAQIILNLISNAEKYGGGEIEVRVRRQETPGGALGCIDVLDRGPGIPPKQVEAIFLPFHRLHDSLSSGIPGSGLGLTLARRMARAHRGNITYAARAGGGSCFTLAIPVAAPPS
jgi:signal transduction histidine kinase